MDKLSEDRARVTVHQIERENRKKWPTQYFCLACATLQIVYRAVFDFTRTSTSTTFNIFNLQFVSIKSFQSPALGMLSARTCRPSVSIFLSFFVALCVRDGVADWMHVKMECFSIRLNNVFHFRRSGVAFAFRRSFVVTWNDLAQIALSPRHLDRQTTTNIDQNYRFKREMLKREKEKNQRKSATSPL